MTDIANCLTQDIDQLIKHIKCHDHDTNVLGMQTKKTGLTPAVTESVLHQLNDLKNKAAKLEYEAMATEDQCARLVAAAQRRVENAHQRISKK